MAPERARGALGRSAPFAAPRGPTLACRRVRCDACDGGDGESAKTSRRRALQSGLATVLAASTSTLAGPALATLGPESNWPLWLALPVAPYARRKTIRRPMGPKVWAFDQTIGIYYVQVPIRMTVVALESGGLFVYAPVAPTEECLSLLRPLIRDHGDVRFIVLPSVAVEHKVLAGPFARRFPNAEFYVASNQYAFPVNLPGSFLGLPSWTKTLPRSSEDMGPNAWAGELRHEVLRVKPGPGSDYQDAAFFHEPSGTLMVCDAVFATTENPPAILESDPEYVRALLFHARDSFSDVPEDTPENRRKGWRRIILYANFFIPGAAVADLGPGPIAEALSQPEYPLGWGGWLPFRWRETELEDFERFASFGRPNILPIIQIILARDPEAVFEWLDRMKGWSFNTVVPAHLDAPLSMGPEELSETFRYAFGEKRNEVRSCDEDVEFLRRAEEGVLNFSVYKTPYGTLRGKEGACGLRRDS